MADTVTMSFPREPHSVPEARAALERFAERIAPTASYDASLCLSELVTNAVQHPGADAGDELELTIELEDDTLRVQVAHDGGPFEPGPPTEGDERGWGLFIVDQLSSRWGARPDRGRTAVWFEVPVE